MDARVDRTLATMVGLRHSCWLLMGLATLTTASSVEDLTFSSSSRLVRG